MKGKSIINKITAKSLIFLTMLLVSAVVIAASLNQYCFSCSTQINTNDRLEQQHRPVFFPESYKKSVLKFAAFRTKKSNILAETDLVLSPIETNPPVIAIERMLGDYIPFYSLPVVFHFTSRGPPSSIV